MTSIAAPHAAVRTSLRKPGSLASARAALGRSFRGLSTVVELERSHRSDDPFVIMGLIRN